MVTYLMQSAICLTCLYGLYYFMLRKETFFHWNRYYLLFVATTSLSIPLLEIPVFIQPQTAQNNTIQLPAVIEYIQKGPQVVAYNLEQLKPQSHSYTVGDAFLFLYLLVLAALSLLFIIRLVRLFLLIHSSKLRHEHGYTIAESNQEHIPASSFFQVIFLNKNAHSQLQHYFIFKHELAHVKGWHSLDVILSELLTIIQWFNPIAWQLRKSLRAIHEYIADDWVVRDTQLRYEYATFLAEQACIIPQKSNASNLHTSFYSQLKNRLTMLAKFPSSPYRAYRYILAIPITIGLLMLFSFTLLNKSMRTDLQLMTQNIERIAQQISETPIIASAPETREVDSFIGLRTPYIFYWGQFQVPILKHEYTDDYFGEVTLTHTEFLNSIERQPRLYNGQSLEPNTQFRMICANQPKLEVQALVHDKSIYDACQKELTSYFIPWQKVERIEVRDLPLPNAKKANLIIHFSTKPGEYQTRKIQEHTFDWAGALRRPTTHLTVDDFWQMASSAPKYFIDDQEVKMPGAITVASKDSNPRILEFETGSGSEGFAHVLESLTQRMDLIKPGTMVYVDFINAPSTVFYIVERNDPKLNGNPLVDATIPESMDNVSAKIRILNTSQVIAETIVISYEIKEDTEVSGVITDPNGEELYHSKKYHKAGKYVIDLSSKVFVPGEYIIIMQSSIGNIEHKFIVK